MPCLFLEIFNTVQCNIFLYIIYLFDICITLKYFKFREVNYQHCIIKMKKKLLNVTRCRKIIDIEFENTVDLVKQFQK